VVGRGVHWRLLCVRVKKFCLWMVWGCLCCVYGVVSGGMWCVWVFSWMMSRLRERVGGTLKRVDLIYMYAYTYKCPEKKFNLPSYKLNSFKFLFLGKRSLLDKDSSCLSIQNFSHHTFFYHQSRTKRVTPSSHSNLVAPSMYIPIQPSYQYLTTISLSYLSTFITQRISHKSKT
jgi:hypothetical protein